MLANDLMHRRRPHAPIHAASPKASWYGSLLLITKLLKVIGVFIVSDLLQQSHVVILLFMLYFVTSCVLTPTQKPFESVRNTQWPKVMQLSVLGVLVHICWLYGITQCGPLRSILLIDQHPVVIIAAIAAVSKGMNIAGPVKFRGMIFLVLGLLCLLLMDRDISVSHDHAESHGHHGGLNHIFYHLTDTFGLPDHKAGIVLLVGAVFMQTGYENAFKRMAVEIGGPRKLYSAVMFASMALSAPLALAAYLFSSFPLSIVSYPEFVFMLCVASFVLFVLAFYAESACTHHLEPVFVHRWATIMCFVSSFVVAWWWFEPYSSASLMDNKVSDDVNILSPVITHHHLSGGVVVTLVLFCLATYCLTGSTNPRAKGAQFIGWDKSGRPLYELQDFLRTTSHSFAALARETLQQVLSKQDSRQIFYFLCVNLAFCGVEFLYGFWTNSLGLISDGFHMLFDCIALVMGLVASVLANWPSNGQYTYGYGRLEVLSGFVNALFLVVISFAIFMNAVGRIFDPPEVRTDKLLAVSVVGLIVNLFGMFAFHGSHGHSHGGGGGSHGHSHGGGEKAHDHAAHGHSHDDASHGHSHDTPKPKPSAHGHSHNANMQGVFLHILADALGSVFVIISTLVITNFGWYIVDPLCSLVLAVLIFLSVLPLLRDSATVLLQCTPDDTLDTLDTVLEQLLHVEGVLSYSRVHAWQLKSDHTLISIHVQVNLRL